MKLFLDENLSPLISEKLRAKGIDAISANQVNLSGSDDIEVAAFCKQSGRILVTLDADFSNIIRYPPKNTCGIIRLKIHPATEKAIWQRLENVLGVLSERELNQKLVIVEVDKIRIRS